MKSLENMSTEELKEISKQLSLKKEELTIDSFINHELTKELQELVNEVFLTLPKNKLKIEIPKLKVEKIASKKKILKKH